jgi:hypothetical protein
MTEPGQPDRAKLFAGVLSASRELLPEVRKKLEELFGPVELESDTFAFDSSDYYEPQMGKNLSRKFYSFETLVEQDTLAAAKLATNRLEKEFAGRCEVERPVNIDPGIMLSSKIILASCKDFSHRIYLGDGVYGEITLQYVKGEFQTLPWTFPDYRKEEYHVFFDNLRRRYTEQFRSQRNGPSPKKDHSDQE